MKGLPGRFLILPVALAVLSVLAVSLIPRSVADPEHAVPVAGDEGPAVEEEAGGEFAEEAGGEYAEKLALAKAFDLRRTAPLLSVPPGAHARALRQRARIEARRSSGIPGAAGRWTPFGRGQLDFGDPTYPRASFIGFSRVAGRVDDLFYDAQNDRVLAAVGNGGVWESLDHGATWRSIGDGLPTQMIGSVAYTPARGGTILALSANGDVSSFFPGSGLGAFWSSNGGRTWRRARGLPSPPSAFSLAVDPTHPNVIYAATGLGLFRSADAGRSFQNVRLPTGDCAGSTAPGPCYLQNVVTDVVVQGPDRFGHRGGAVVAAVGWIFGDLEGPTGEPQATHNGIYRSRSGRPGTFAKVPEESGFAPDDRVGRVELAAADGPRQDSRFVYAVVQDVKLLRGGLPYDLPGDPEPGPLPTNINGVYVSGDFGRTWTKMAGMEELTAPTTGSSLSPSWYIGGLVLGASPAPGYQAWYNETIRVDPTRQTEEGIPTRLTFGLEEVWRNEFTDQPQDGHSVFRVIGRYLGRKECNFVNAPVCPFNRDTYRGPTLHVDQHASVFVPERDGGVTFLAGNDGGVYRQRVGPEEELDNTKWETGLAGFHTLLPYNAAWARDGIAYAGMQDNGTMRVGRDGRQVGVFDSDGFGVAVDPADSNTAYQIIQFGVMHATTDGGHSWKSISPALVSPPFWTPFAMDPLDPDHLLVAGRDVKESVYGPETNSANQTQLFYNPVIPEFPEDGHDPTSEKNWATVFDLGTKAGGSVRASAVALHGDAAYVAGCTHCNPINRGSPFVNRLATNVGRRKPPEPMTSNGWHVAAARGLPRRFITSIVIDPRDPRTVYVTLGGYAAFVEPGQLGESTRGIAGGHVYVSTDAGEHFRDISANLPDVPANWVVLRGRQLIVATDIGVFISKDRRGGRYSLLGNGLPIVPVLSVQLRPGDPDLLLAATYGRGLYTYRFP